MASEKVLSSDVSCHCLCHNPGFDETCPYCERHPELHVSAPTVQEQSSAVAPNSQPANAGRKEMFNTLTLLPFAYSTGVFAVSFLVLGVPMILAGIDFGDRVLISQGIFFTVVMFTIFVLPPVLLFAFKLLKPIFLPISYPFIGLFTIVKYTLVGVWTILKYLPIGVWMVVRRLMKFALGLFFAATVKRKCDKEHNIGAYHDDCVCFMPSIAVISLVTILLLALSLIAVSDVLELNDFIIFFSAHPILFWGIAAYYATNILSLFYELGRWSSYKSYNKRLESATV